MGVKLSELVVAKPITLEYLKGKVLFVDAFNMLYQFLTTIRQPDGTPLRTSRGEVTSHLVGLFSRVTKLQLAGLKLAFVFDGKPPELKRNELERRSAGKQVAEEKYELAVAEQDIEGMRKYAARTSRLTQEMIEQSKALLGAMGLPIIQAPSEGEAAAAELVRQGRGYAAVSEDFDALLFGVPRLVRGLSVTRKRKQRDALNYIKTEIEEINLEDTLNALRINQMQLIALGLLIGTDFNPGGIPGIGPKKALALLQRFGNDFAGLFKEVDWDKHFPYEWERVFMIFSESVRIDPQLQWGRVNATKIRELLVERFEFDPVNVDKRLEQLQRHASAPKQSGLSEFF